MSEFKIGDEVYVKDWMQRYSDVYKWVNNVRTLVWNWKTKIPDYSAIDFHIQREYKPKLTLKGKPYKNGDTILISEIPVYKNYKYTILEKTINLEGEDLFLIASKEGCYVQINEFGITTLNIEEQKRVEHLESEKRLQALAKDNLNKWTINDDFNKFPKELIKYLYDTNQNTQFGSGMTKAIIKYPYISKEYTINNNDICLGWEQEFNGTGCDLSDKEIINWNQLSKRFPENKFKN
jgi:hypothetical protein